MFTPEYFINSLQNSKKTVINTFVADKDIKEGLTNLVDAQTQFYENVSKNVVGISKALIGNYTTPFKAK